MKYPRHVAIIADGNRTRAENQGLTPMDGHFQGAKHTLDILAYLFEHTPIDVFTGRFLSTENMINRSPDEVAFICNIYVSIGDDIDWILEKYHVNFRWVGNAAGLPEGFLHYLNEKAKKYTYTDSPKMIVLAINYWGRDEIMRGIHKRAEAQPMLVPWVTEGLTTDILSSYMDFADMPALDLVIRTKASSAMRTSGFMARWIGYAELYFARELYPDFWPEQIEKALQWYDSIADERNFGK